MYMYTRKSPRLRVIRLFDWDHVEVCLGVRCYNMVSEIAAGGFLIPKEPFVKLAARYYVLNQRPYILTSSFSERVS